jgi:hypothetical protein
MNDQSQLNHFARQLATHLKLPPFTFQDWTNDFEHLSSHIKSGNIILFDKISGKGTSYKKILDSLKDGIKTLADIRTIT